MAARTLRLKVSVAALTAKIEAAKAEQQVKHLDALAEYEAASRAWPAAAKAAVREWLKTNPDPENWWVDTYYSRKVGEYIPVAEVPIPPRPNKPRELNTAHMDRDLALLRATTEETITVGADDNLASYL